MRIRTKARVHPAHSFTGGRRFYNTSDISEYLNAFETEVPGASAVILDEICSRDDLIFEYVFTGLRKTEGISLDDFRERFGIAFSEYYKSKIPYITEQVKQEFMFTVPDDDSFDFKSGRLGLTLLGIDVSNSIMSEFAERD